MATQQKPKTQEDHNGLAAQASEIMHQPAEMIKEYPLTSMLVVFGVGIGVGLIATQAMCESSSSSSNNFSRYTGGWDSRSAERFGRQVYDSLANMVPSSVSRQFHS
jgi:hypothetical protein